MIASAAGDVTRLNAPARESNVVAAAIIVLPTSDARAMMFT